MVSHRLGGCSTQSAAVSGRFGYLIQESLRERSWNANEERRVLLESLLEKDPTTRPTAAEAPGDAEDVHAQDPQRRRRAGVAVLV
jgi:hypothetical protein